MKKTVKRVVFSNVDDDVVYRIDLFDKKGDLIEKNIERKQSNGELFWSLEKYSYEYDEYGRKVLAMVQNDNDPMYSIKYEYDYNGTIVKEVRIDKKNGTNTEKVTLYDVEYNGDSIAKKTVKENGICRRIDEYVDGLLIRRTLFSYDAVLKCEEVSMVHEYVLDNNGKVVTETISAKGKDEIIEYYYEWKGNELDVYEYVDGEKTYLIHKEYDDDDDIVFYKSTRLQYRLEYY